MEKITTSLLYHYTYSETLTTTTTLSLTLTLTQLRPFSFSFSFSFSLSLSLSLTDPPFSVLFISSSLSPSFSLYPSSFGFFSPRALQFFSRRPKFSFVNEDPFFMEELGSPQFGGIGNIIRKKRSQTSRRPRPESLQFSESHDHSPLTLTPASDDVSKVSSDENTGGDTNSRRKEFNLNRCVLKGSASKAGGYPHKRIKKDGSSGLSYGNGGLEDSIDQGGSGLNQRQHSEEISTPAKWKSTSKTKGSLELRSTTSDIHDGRNGEIQGSEHPRMNGNELGNNKLKKVKLKVGGVTCTIQTKSNSQGASGGGYSTKNSRTSDAPRSRPKLILQDNSDDDNSPLYKNSGMLGIPWKDFSRDSSTWAKEDSSMGKMPSKNASGNQVEKSEPVRKSKRVPKRRVLDGAFDEDDEDDEIRYLEKLRTFKIAAGREDFEEESIKKQQRISRVSKNGKCDEILEDFASMSSKDGKKKSRSERGSEDTDYDEEEELVSDGEPGGNKKKKPRKDSIDSSIESKRDSSIESKREPALTTRQRALLNKDASSASGASVIEFPSGLPPVPPRKQKEKLSETEQQLKKAEAAQRRRVQVEKAARESEAEAIRKILGQDSSRKKREDKIKKRQEELAQERAANALMLPSNTIRYVTGPTGTIVTFSKDMGLPSIFYSKPCSYPPPREKCAGPSCTNPYKYRDSKSKLPLCSLHCYKAVHEQLQPETTG